MKVALCSESPFSQLSAERSSEYKIKPREGRAEGKGDLCLFNGVVLCVVLL